MVININRLDERHIKNLQANGKVQRLCDGGKLWLVMQPTGTRTFRMLWKDGSIQKQYTIGEYPGISLDAARTERDRILDLIDQGIDPNVEKKKAVRKARIERDARNRTFQVVAEEWHEKCTAKFSDKYRASTKQRLQNHVFPLIGKKPIADIEFDDLLEIVQSLEEKNIPDTAQRVCQFVTRIFAYAKTRRYVQTNVAHDIKDSLYVTNTLQHRAAILEPDMIGLLLRDIDAYKGFYSVRYALKILPYVFLRSKELRLANWDEIDFDKAQWTIPVGHMKMKKEHVVPLSTQVVAYLKELKSIQGNSELLFPSPRTTTRCITDETLLAGLRRMGYSRDEMCVHGFRSMASTRLNEMGFRPDVIEAQLAHTQGNAVRAAYNRAQYLEERTDMMQKWADYLDELRTKAPA